MLQINPLCVSVCAHLSQDLYTWGEVLACRGMSQSVFTHKGDHLVESRHAYMLHCRWFLCLVHIHQSPEHIRKVCTLLKTPPWCICTYFYCDINQWHSMFILTWWSSQCGQQPEPGFEVEEPWSRFEASWCPGAVMLSGSAPPPVSGHAHTVRLQRQHTNAFSGHGKNILKCLVGCVFVFFFGRTVTVMFAGPWHGCPPFPLHSRAMVTCSGWFL